MFLAALAVAAVACGSAAAIIPSTSVQVRASLAPVSRANAPGKFGGLLVNGGVPGRWELTWKLSLPSLRGSKTASLEVGAARVLCRQCTRGARGALKLTVSQALRVTHDDAVIVVETPHATLRGPVEASVHVPVPFH